jgi:hypothetical protein
MVVVTGLAVHPLAVIAQGAEKTGKPEAEKMKWQGLKRNWGSLSFRNSPQGTESLATSQKSKEARGVSNAF